MLDLSNNNAKNQNFIVVYTKAGQRRVYLKRCQGVNFTDETFPGLSSRALQAGLEVGEYDFLEPLLSTPAEAAAYLLKLTKLPLKHGRDLRIALDSEYGTPSDKVGIWITEVADIVARAIKTRPVIYGSGYYLEACKFKVAPGPLWLAAFSRNDGKEYPVGKIPVPWKTVAAHQYTSNATILGITGKCDMSHVFVPSLIDYPSVIQKVTNRFRNL